VVDEVVPPEDYMHRFKLPKPLRNLQKSAKRTQKSIAHQWKHGGGQNFRKVREDFLRATVDPTYRDKLAHIDDVSTYDPVGWESKRLRDERRREAEDLILSLAGTATFLGTKNKSLAQAVNAVGRAGYTHRYYQQRRKSATATRFRNGRPAGNSRYGYSYDYARKNAVYRKKN